MRISAVLVIPVIILTRHGFKTAVYGRKQSKDFKRDNANMDNVYLSNSSSGMRLGVQIRF